MAKEIKRNNDKGTNRNNGKGAKKMRVKDTLMHARTRIRLKQMERLYDSLMMKGGAGHNVL